MDLAAYKLNEMMQPSRSPAPVRGVGLDNLAGLGQAATVAFTDASGNPTTTVEVGNPYGFIVSGYTSVWLIMSKNGQQIFNSQLAVPMALHMSQQSEIGQWQATAYDLNTGATLGTASINIVAAGTSTGTGGASAFFANLTPTQMLIGGAAILFLLTRKRGHQ